MGSDWDSVKLGEFAYFNYGKGLPKRKRNEKGNIPVYGSNGIVGYHDEAMVEEGIVIGRKGTIGESQFVQEPFWAIDTTFFIEDAEDRDLRFTYYLLKSLPLQEMNSDSAVPGLNRNAVHNLNIKIPDKNEQKRIADILGTLDDKIELNRQMNRTLEAMARAIFKSWFVDFDPVTAKMEGRDSPLPAEVMDLFPDELVESELGLIPKGWEVGKLKQGFNITMGQSPPGDTYNEDGDGLPFYQGRRDFGFRFPALRVYCNAPKRLAHPNDSLVSVRAPVGDVNMAKEECCIGRGVAAVRHKTGSASFTYYSMLKLKDYFNVFESEGTVFGSISKKDFKGLEVVIPPHEFVQAYEDHTGVLDKKIENNSEQINTLIIIRDTLLPKLMSGEIMGFNNYG